ncbi:HNH endonuclease signature motif containing protein [Arthrobacter celericrescens]|uniref:HNH endonuclease signature motif containing protein n=1 Tax=Arthrobacter celericrescens TaxID=2320851 RepID=UPI000EA37E50|nr:HNH endonuclease signature motif containing protein [Arthrobacter celericrescens]
MEGIAQLTGPRTVTSAAVMLLSARPAGRAARGVEDALEQADDALASLRIDAAAEARLFGFAEAADFAGRVEELSRAVEFLQLVAAHAVERTRHEGQQDPSSAPGWRTGWTEAATVSRPTARSAPEFVDDGYRNAAEFLRARLRISISEARRRLALAPDVLSSAGMAGQDIPPRREVLAAAVSSALVPSRSATVVSATLDSVRHLIKEDAMARLEQELTAVAAESDPDFLVKTAKRWTDAIDQDGAEPSEEALRQLQGAFVRKPRHGLRHLEIFATAEQFETLTTVMNVAGNPRLQDTAGGGDAELDRRSRAQKLLDGLVGACGVALAAGELPANGGLRPQVMVTINYRDLLEQLNHAATTASPQGSPRTSSGSATFQGPIHPNIIRKIACDADIIPVLLGSDSRVLDIGRTSRIFPPHIRKAIIARDQGCAFPECTIPAPWCEAHHITYWSHGGPTSTGNGTLLCSHHHHVIHKEQWKITFKAGVPWFVPPPHVDPRQTPRRNHHHTPLRT